MKAGGENEKRKGEPPSRNAGTFPWMRMYILPHKTFLSHIVFKCVSLVDRILTAVLLIICVVEEELFYVAVMYMCNKGNARHSGQEAVQPFSSPSLTLEGSRWIHPSSSNGHHSRLRERLPRTIVQDAGVVQHAVELRHAVCQVLNGLLPSVAVHAVTTCGNSSTPSRRSASPQKRYRPGGRSHCTAAFVQ